MTGSAWQLVAVAGSHRQITDVGNRKCNYMSTNIRIKKVCEYCGEVFIAKTLKTRFCSHRCNSKSYKQKQRDTRLAEASEVEPQTTVEANAVVEAALVNIKQLAAILHIGERTLYRLIKDDNFPRIKLGARLLFNKTEVFYFINHKYKSV